MLIKALFVCRTPFQVLLANRIIQHCQLELNDVHALYVPHSDSKKHKYYFDKLQASLKAFIPFQTTKLSHTLSEAHVILRMPRWAHLNKFENIYFASLSLFPLSYIIALNPKSVLHSFDCGIFYASNLVQEWIYDEPRNRVFLKKLLRLPSNPLIASKILYHYTIMLSKVIRSSPKMIVKLSITDVSREVSSIHKEKSHLVVILGTCLLSDHLHKRYLAFLQTLDYDIFLAHPQEGGKSRVCSLGVQSVLRGIDLNLMIAEDLVSYLASKNLQLTVYGFDSGVLAAVVDIARCINVVFENTKRNHSDIFAEMGIPSISI